MSAPPLPDDGDHGLAAALAAHPEARVTAILPTGEFCALPAELGSTHERLPGTTIFELVPMTEWPKVIGGWQLVQLYGSQAGVLTELDGNVVSVLSFDARERFGVVVTLFVPDASIGARLQDDGQVLSARFGTYHRDMLSGVIDIDEGARRLLGWELAEIRDRPGRDLIHPDDVANAEANWMTTMVMPGEPQRWRGRHLHADGTYRWIEFTNTSRLEDLGHVVSEMMDISEEMATAQALRRRDELLARLNDALPLGVLETDTDHRVTYANHRLPVILGRDRAETLEEQFDTVTPADRLLLHQAVVRTMTAGTDVDLEIRLHVRTLAQPDRVCAVSVRALHEDDVISGAVLCVSDITEATSMRRQLEHQATYDRLTGCHNREATMTALDAELDRADEDPGTAVLFIDLDRFKPVNDEHGHAVGDRLLTAVAERIRHLVRDGDVVGRIGGDEFLVVCPRTARDTAERIAGRITAALEDPVALPGATVRIGASIGVAWSADRATTADSIVAAADAEMYECKRTRHARHARHDAAAG